MILGNICTRSCGFCNVATGRPETVDWEGAGKGSSQCEAYESEARSSYFCRPRRSRRWRIYYLGRDSKGHSPDSPQTTMETLIPDFKGELHNVDRIIEANPEIVSHNMETVRRLTRKVRIQAQFDRSLMVLKYLKDNGIHRTKSGIMLGLGETKEEVIDAMKDLREADVDILTLGQYFSLRQSICLWLSLLRLKFLKN